jgi:hypothetical protein
MPVVANIPMRSASDPLAFLGRLRKNTPGGKKCQGTTLQAAEKLVQAIGRGFIPGIKANGISGVFSH